MASDELTQLLNGGGDVATMIMVFLLSTFKTRIDKLENDVRKLLDCALKQTSLNRIADRENNG